MFREIISRFHDFSPGLRGILVVLGTLLIGVAGNLIAPYVSLLPKFGFWGALSVCAFINILVIAAYETTFQLERRKWTDRSESINVTEGAFEIEFLDGGVKGQCKFSSEFSINGKARLNEITKASMFKGMIVFVNKPKTRQKPDESLPYSILNYLDKINDGVLRRVWLLCGDFDDRATPSLELARQLKLMFSGSSNLTVELAHVSNLDDPSNVSETVSNILHDATRNEILFTEILADCTSGIRWVYIWLTMYGVTGVRLGVLLTHEIEDGYGVISIPSLMHLKNHF